MSWRTVHRAVGALTVVVFLGTGAYMRMRFPELYGDNEVIRYQYRANHIHILTCGLLQLVLGTYLGRGASGRWPRLAATGSWLLLAAPVLLVTAFFVEPANASPVRPITAAGVFAMALGVSAHVLGGRPSSSARRGD